MNNQNQTPRNVRVFTYLHHNNKVACVIKVSSITDFALNTQETKNFIQDVMLNASFYKQGVDVLDNVNIKTQRVLKDEFLELRKQLKEDIQLDSIQTIY